MSLFPKTQGNYSIIPPQYNANISVILIAPLPLRPLDITINRYKDILFPLLTVVWKQLYHSYYFIKGKIRSL